MLRLKDTIIGVRDFKLFDGKMLLSFFHIVKMLDKSKLIFEKNYDTKRVLLSTGGDIFRVIAFPSIEIYDNKTLKLKKEIRFENQVYFIDDRLLIGYNEKVFGEPGSFTLFNIDGKTYWSQKSTTAPRLDVFFNSSYFLYIAAYGQKRLFCHDLQNGALIWKSDLSQMIDTLYPNENGQNEIMSKPVLYKNLAIVRLKNMESTVSYLVALDLETGELKWHQRGYNNFELHKDKIYSLGFDGNLRILNPETGILETEENLNSEFERMNVNCDYSFTVTDDKIYFKHGRKGKVGILNLENLNVEEVIQLPEGNTIGTSEPPISSQNRLYIRSAPQNNLFVYERE